jgi:hypothetical protein
VRRKDKEVLPECFADFAGKAIMSLSVGMIWEARHSLPFYLILCVEKGEREERERAGFAFNTCLKCFSISRLKTPVSFDLRTSFVFTSHLSIFIHIISSLLSFMLQCCRSTYGMESNNGKEFSRLESSAGISWVASFMK